MPILSISSLHRLEIHTDEIVETTKVSTLATIPSYIEQFIFDSGSTINWNEFSLTLPEFTRIRLLSISLIDRSQKSVPSFIFQNLRTLSLGLLEVSFNWIIQLLTKTLCLVKLKLTGLVDADGFVVNQMWIRLFESAQTLVRIFVNVSLELDNESYHCEKIQAPLCALNLSLICNGDDNDCNVFNMNNRCLFCTQRSAAVCCLRCRTTDISTMFETLLTLLGKASMISNYYDQIRTICQQIETLEWFLTPIQFTSISHFDPKVHKVEQEAKLYLQQTSLDVQNMIPIEVAADGNCLYNSIIRLSGNTASTPSELRVRTLIELVKNEMFYHNRCAHIVGPVNEAIKNIARNFSFSELYEIAALSNVLNCNIQSVYPTIDYRSDLNIMNNTFEHAQCSIASKTICLFWTHTESEIEARRSNAGNWSPNHFVPL
ncbi:unnamed protein product, partial [Rotaria magnacalcarata]